MDLNEAVLERLAYALADQLHEACNPGRWRSNAAAGGTLAEVVRRHAVAPEAVELVRQAVSDALERRRPRW